MVSQDCWGLVWAPVSGLWVWLRGWGFEGLGFGPGLRGFLPKSGFELRMVLGK